MHNSDLLVIARVSRTSRTRVPNNIRGKPLTTRLQLRLFGEFQATLGDRQLRLPLRKAQALLTYLAFRPGQPVSRDKLASLLWSMSGPEQARQSLRQTLFSLRKELGSEPILLEEGDYLRLSACDADVARCETLVTAGEMSAAVKLYAGPFLEGFVLGEERFDHWVAAERQRLHELALDAHRQLMAAQMRDGDVDGAVETARRALELDPMQEPVHRSLMRFYISRGDRTAALAQYEQCAKVLRRELRIDPDHDTRRLQIEAQEMGDAAPAATSSPQSILVVEDNILSRQLSNAVLTQAGYRVILARDGAEALLHLGKEKIDLMVLDVDLPYLDGHSLLRAAQQNGIEAPAIFVSGLPGEEIEIKAFELGAADFIRKPVRNQVLVMRVGNVLRATRVA
jgi:DNA-binding SARP family transcriptional activator